MIIKESQISTLGAPSVERLIYEAIEFLKENTSEWAADKNDLAIRASIVDMITKGKELKIRKQINTQKLLYHWIKYDLKTIQ